VSAQGPFGDDSSPDPFAAFGGLFGDLARLSAQQGPLHWDAARQLAWSVATGGKPEPNVDPIERMTIAELARVAELHVGRVTGLATSQTGRPVSVEPVTRTQWATTALDDYKPWFDVLAGSLTPSPMGGAPAAPDDGPDDGMGFLGPLLQMMGPVMLGMTAGSMVGHLARRSFGQYDLPLARPRRDALQVVPANVDEFGDQWSLERDDLRLWVCVHEVAHHAVLGVEHVRTRLDGLLRDYLGAFETNDNGLEERLAGMQLDDPSSLAAMQEMFADPQILLGAIRSKEQEAMLPHIEALVAVVVGVVDHTMDRIGEGLIGSYGRVTEAVRRRRVEAGQADRFVERLLGLELTQAQVDRGGAFVRGVLERAGDDGLARLWASERELPTPAEVDAPGLWLARIDLPQP
jgi:putative hydrolase